MIGFSVKRVRMQTGGFQEIIGVSASIQALRVLLEKVSASVAPVLLLGASGTGKEIVAKSIHNHSERASKPFVALNCGAIPADLLESELFGHEKGSFTGAIQTRIGRFEQANGGTLLLDEIGDMPLNMQVKLLRVIETKSFERVGGRTSIPTNVRIIAATHRHLEEAIKTDAFREDLYYRLNVLPIQIPLLKDRPEDIPLLIQHLAPNIQLTKESVRSLQAHPWPGNIRELHNLLERLSLLYPNEMITLDLLPDLYKQEKSKRAPLTTIAFDLKQHLEDIERSFIEEALHHSRNIISQAANNLGLRRTTLVEKMKKYAISKGGH